MKILFNETSKEIQEAVELLMEGGISVDIKEVSLLESMLAYKDGDYDLLISGHIFSTREVIKAALQSIQTKTDRTKITSFIILENKKNDFYLFADCAVNLIPSLEDIVQIAIDAAESYLKLTGTAPRIAFISYSTHGSGQGESVQKMKGAYALFTKKYPAIFADGELQMDAALDSSTYKKKTGKDLREPFNVFVFPNLDTANTAYKTATVLGNMKAYGPFIVGLEKPIVDLSRSATAEEIAKTVSIGLLLANS